jgi:hypothetical protein
MTNQSQPSIASRNAPAPLIEPQLPPVLLHRMRQALERYADPAQYPKFTDAEASGFFRGSAALESFMKEGREVAAEMAALFVGCTTAPVILAQVYRTLGHYGNFSAYQAPRIGGVLAGCPRGAKPTPTSLAFDAKLVLRNLNESPYRTVGLAT